MFETKKSIIVFDFDGVLIESNEIKRREFVKIWNKKIDSNIVNNIIGESGDRFEIIEKIYNRFLSKKERKEFSKSFYLNKYSKNVENQILELGLKIGVQSFLEKSNKSLMINSATPDENLNIILKKLDISQYFECICGGNMSKKKNFYYMRSLFNKEFDDMIFYGDMESDRLVADDLGIEFSPIYSIGTDFK